MWQFNLSKSPWWEGMYERIMKEIKTMLYKTVGKAHLTFEQLNIMVMDIERHLNNHPLTYVESDGGEEQILTPNTIMWGQQSKEIIDLPTICKKAKCVRYLNSFRFHIVVVVSKARLRFQYFPQPFHLLPLQNLMM